MKRIEKEILYFKDKNSNLKYTKDDEFLEEAIKDVTGLDCMSSIVNYYENSNEHEQIHTSGTTHTMVTTDGYRSLHDDSIKEIKVCQEIFNKNLIDNTINTEKRNISEFHIYKNRNEKGEVVSRVIKYPDIENPTKGDIIADIVQESSYVYGYNYEQRTLRKVDESSSIFTISNQSNNSEKNKFENIFKVGLLDALIKNIKEWYSENNPDLVNDVDIFEDCIKYILRVVKKDQETFYKIEIIVDYESIVFRLDTEQTVAEISELIPSLCVVFDINTKRLSYIQSYNTLNKNNDVILGTLRIISDFGDIQKIDDSNSLTAFISEQLYFLKMDEAKKYPVYENIIYEDKQFTINSDKTEYLQIQKDMIYELYNPGTFKEDRSELSQELINASKTFNYTTDEDDNVIGCKTDLQVSRNINKENNNIEIIMICDTYYSKVNSENTIYSDVLSSYVFDDIFTDVESPIFAIFKYNPLISKIFSDFRKDFRIDKRDYKDNGKYCKMYDINILPGVTEYYYDYSDRPSVIYNNHAIVLEKHTVNFPANKKILAHTENYYDLVKVDFNYNNSNIDNIFDIRENKIVKFNQNGSNHSSGEYKYEKRINAPRLIGCRLLNYTIETDSNINRNSEDIELSNRVIKRVITMCEKFGVEHDLELENVDEGEMING